MRQINTIVQMAEQGVSHPFLCKDENENLWWCKGHLSGEPTQQYEWICANLAKSLSLPVPDFEICEVPVSLFRVWLLGHPECPGQFVTASNPYVFASRRIPDCRDLSPNSPFITKGDRDLQARIFVFDRIIRNMDRTEGNTNTLLDASGSEIHVIDHNGAFDATFDEEQFLKEHIFRDAFLALSPQDRQKMADEIQQTVSSFDLDAIWYEMPDAWTDESGTGLTLNDVRGILFTRWSPLP